MTPWSPGVTYIVTFCLKILANLAGLADTLQVLQGALARQCGGATFRSLPRRVWRGLVRDTETRLTVNLFGEWVSMRFAMFDTYCVH